MKRISVLLASAPTSPSARRAFQLMEDLTEQGHLVTLCLLEDGVYAATGKLEGVPLDRCAAVLALTEDMRLRGIDAGSLPAAVRPASYGEVVDRVMTGSDQTLGAF
ncbi:MAG: DsrH/TusB family sulfur metabolism protein [Bacillota bacterium]